MIYALGLSCSLTAAGTLELDDCVAVDEYCMVTPDPIVVVVSP
jgi:hypothetical protein